jgi:hypothetical protein
MAALQAIRERLAAECDAGLTTHESRCLCKRLSECDELLQLAILGADRACSKTHCAAELVAIRSSLEVAEAQIRQARVLAGQVLISTPASIDSTRQERTA